MGVDDGAETEGAAIGAWVGAGAGAEGVVGSEGIPIDADGVGTDIVFCSSEEPKDAGGITGAILLIPEFASVDGNFDRVTFGVMS